MKDRVRSRYAKRDSAAAVKKAKAKAAKKETYMYTVNDFFYLNFLSSTKIQMSGLNIINFFLSTIRCKFSQNN